MAVNNRRQFTARRRVRNAYAKRYALLVFVIFSLIMGLLVFGVFAFMRGCCRDDEPATSVGATQTDGTTPDAVITPTFAPEESKPAVSVVPDAPDVPDYVKQQAPSSVTYAVADSDTVSLGNEADSESIILIDISSGSIVASKSHDKRVYPASLTKVMTLITAYDYIEDPYTEHFTMTREILAPLISSGNSLAGFEVGESSPLIDYMYGMIMFSGADAAEGIAVHCCGSVDAFVDAMNKKAAQIGLKNSNFTNPVGTHDADHYSTAHDMALVLGYAYEVDILSQILNTYRYTSNPTDIHPEGLYWESNLQQRMKGDESGTCEVLGGKTGFTNDAKHCVVAYARSVKTGKYYLFAATGGEKMYDPIWDCINTLKDHVK